MDDKELKLTDMKVVADENIPEHIMLFISKNKVSVLNLVDGVITELTFDALDKYKEVK